jgi:DNA mismatch repair ATPase MutL
MPMASWPAPSQARLPNQSLKLGDRVQSLLSVTYPAVKSIATDPLQVEDLFYNVPSRRRAFRSASEEYAKILDLVGRYAVHCAGVAFSCKKAGDNSGSSVSVPAAAETKDRIRQIHGSAAANELVRLTAKDQRWGSISRLRYTNGWPPFGRKVA